jgi:hypothetical protein
MNGCKIITICEVKDDKCDFFEQYMGIKKIKCKYAVLNMDSISNLKKEFVCSCKKAIFDKISEIF